MLSWQQLDPKIAKRDVQALYAENAARPSPFATFDHWSVERLLGRPTVDEPAEFNEMMPLWVGALGVQPAKPHVLESYRSFLDAFGLGARFHTIVDELAADRQCLLLSDARCVQDFLLIEKHYREGPTSGPRVVLEVGGGFGRLAEIFLRWSAVPTCYVLVDGVPESILFQYAYLRERLPEARIGASFRGDRFVPTDYDAFLLFAADLPAALPPSLDVAINVASIQEMPEATVTAYLDLLGERVRRDGIVLFENSRIHFYRRAYHFPSRWRYLVKAITPRSKALDFPVDILRVTDEDQSSYNIKIVQDYYMHVVRLAEWRLRQQARRHRSTEATMKKQMADLRRKNMQIKNRLRAKNAEAFAAKKKTAEPTSDN